MVFIILVVLFDATSVNQESTPSINENDANDPDEFKDPVLFALMKNPEIINCGHTFDTVTLDELASYATKTHQDCSRCPLCRAKIQTRTPNIILKNRIDEFVAPQKDEKIEAQETSIQIEKGLELNQTASVTRVSIFSQNPSHPGTKMEPQKINQLPCPG